MGLGLGLASQGKDRPAGTPATEASPPFSQGLLWSNWDLPQLTLLSPTFLQGSSHHTAQPPFLSDNSHFPLCTGPLPARQCAIAMETHPVGLQPSYNHRQPSGKAFPP